MPRVGSNMRGVPGRRAARPGQGQAQKALLTAVGPYGARRRAGGTRMLEVEGHLVPLLAFLREDCGMTDAAVAKVLVKCERPLGWDLSDSGTVRAVQRYLRRELGLEAQNLARVVLAYPALLGRGVANLQAKVDLLVGTGSAPDHAAVGQLLVKHPSLLNSCLERLQTTTACLKELGVSDQQLQHIVHLQPVLLKCMAEAAGAGASAGTNARYDAGRVVFRLVCRQPVWLLLNVDSPVFQRKLQYFEQRIGRARCQMVESPSYMCASLSNRTVPRTEYMLAYCPTGQRWSQAGV